MTVKAIPDGYHTLTPYLSVKGASDLIGFLQRAFGAQEIYRMADPDGHIHHAEVQVGTSRMMLTEACDKAPAAPTGFYLYVEDVDAAYKQAVAAGGKSLQEPEDQFYGDRTAGVSDPSGCTWYLGTHIEDVSPEELARRAAAGAAAPAGA